MSLLSLNGSYEFALILAILGLIAAVTFTVGWKTRVSNLILWLVIISFQARFPEANTSGGDMLLRIFFFFSLFLPMSAVYSFDRAVSEKEYKDKEYFSVFTAMWILQVFSLYFFTFIYKWEPVYHTTFEAVWYMLQLELYTKPFGQWLGQHLMLTKFLSASCYALELIGPLMLLIPWRRDLWRGIAVISFWGFHLGIFLTMYLGNFVPICWIIWVGLIPTAWWDYLAKRTKSIPKKLMTLYHDSESKFARQLGLITKDMLMLDSVDVCAFPLKKQKLLSEHELFIGEDKEQKTYLKGFALASSLMKTSSLAPVRALGRMLASDYSLMMNDAKEAGGVSITSDAIESDEEKKSRLLGVLKEMFEFFGFDSVKYRLNKLERYFGSFILFLVLAWNVEGVIKERDWYIGSPFDEIMFTLQLNQGWAMFAPHPQRGDSWWVMEGTLSNGEQWDALHNKEVSFDRPDSFYATYSSEDWRSFLDNLSGTRDETYLLALGRYFCRSWNAKHTGDKALVRFNLHFMQEWTNPPGEKPELRKITLWNHSCF